jgi:hypothetical protein
MHKTKPSMELITAVALLEMRRAMAKNEWVFRAQTKSGHIEKS